MSVVEVAATDEFAAWYDALDVAEKRVVTHIVDMLEDRGLALGHPHTSAIRGSRHALRELRPKKGRSPLRIFYAFDPKRQAIVLIGGNKAGDNAFYDRMVPWAEVIWEQYLVEQAAGLHEKGEKR